MGGPNSGRRDDGTGARNKPKMAIAVCGSGIPERPVGIEPNVLLVWDRIAEVTQGLTFSQDSFFLEELANTQVEQKQIREQLRTLTIGSEEWDKAFNSLQKNRRALLILWSRLGLDPRSRQSLLRPSESEAKDEFEEMFGDASRA